MITSIFILCVRLDPSREGWKDKVGMPCVLSENGWGPSPTWKVCDVTDLHSPRAHAEPQVFFSRDAAEKFRHQPARPWTKSPDRPLGWDDIAVREFTASPGVPRGE